MVEVIIFFKFTPIFFIESSFVLRPSPPTELVKIVLQTPTAASAIAHSIVLGSASPDSPVEGGGG